MRIFYFILLLTCFQSVEAQRQAKEQKLFHEAEDAMFDGENEEAISKLEKAIKIKPGFVRAVRLLARVHKEEENYDDARKVFETYGQRFPENQYKVDLELGLIEMTREDFPAAIELFEKVKANPNCPEKTKLRCDREIAKSTFRKGMMDNPVPFEPIHLGENVNSEFNEYLPSTNAEESQLLFTRNVFPAPTPLGNEDIYMSRKQDDGSWGPAAPLGKAINTDNMEGALSISPDGKRLFFAASARPTGFGNYDIYYSYLVDGRWVKPQNIGEPISSNAYDSQPSISANGQEIFFVSKRTGNVGPLDDIWTSRLIENRWQDPVNIGAINTKGKEQMPFIHPDGQTLYFTSDGHPGMGNSDIFFCRRDAEGNWGEPQNLGYPVNTKHHETGVFVNREGTHAFFSRANGENGLDLYSFELPAAGKPTFTTFVSGKVIDEKTKEPLVAEIKIQNLSDESIAHTAITSRDGTFLLTLPTGQNYSYYVEKEGYVFHSENFNLDKLKSSGSFKLEIELNPIEAKASVVLRNIFFETDSYVIKESSNPELEKLHELLSLNSAMKIALIGHTDSVGDEKYNLELSQNRAAAIRQNLSERGIDANRIVSSGEGETNPIASNDNEEGRKVNRRVEMIITEQ